MTSTVTAVYRTREVANLVRRELASLGVHANDIHVIPDLEAAVDSAHENEHHRLMDEIHDLNLPEEDVRTYQGCVRRGDVVVSTDVDDDLVPRVRDIMRRPEAEAHNLGLAGEAFRTEPVVPYSDETRVPPDPSTVRPRDTASTDLFTRTYRSGPPSAGAR